ncbi:hypothetical protein LSAT2_004865, partial [Lamellibrachia satsuma]
DKKWCHLGFCKNGAKCVDAGGKYTCFCTNEYKGFNCTGRATFAAHVAGDIGQHTQLTWQWTSGNTRSSSGTGHRATHAAHVAVDIGQHTQLTRQGTSGNTRSSRGGGHRATHAAHVAVDIGQHTQLTR